MLLRCGLEPVDLPEVPVELAVLIEGILDVVEN
jgi:hypothetical protein